MKTFKASKINPYTILADLIMNLWVIALAAVIGFVGSVTYYSYLYKREYTSSMTVSVNLSGYTTDSTAVSLARTVMIAEILDDVFQSDALRDVVQKDLGEEAAGEISAQQLGETNLIAISVTDESPYKAYATLKSVYNNYMKVTDYVFSNVIIMVVANPQMPVTPSNAVPVMKTGVMFGILAALLAGVLIVVLSYMRDTVKNVSDVEDELDARLFGTVRKVKTINRSLPKEKRRLIITNPLVGYDFAESFRRIAVKLECLKRTKGIKSVMITSVAENEGKTSMSINTAIALSQNGHKVLLVDCDFRKPSLYRFFDMVPHPENSDFHSYIKEGGDITKYIKHDAETGVFLLDCVEPCTNSSDILGDRRFGETINALKSEFDFIVIDTPPCGMTVDPEIISGSVDGMLMVVRQDYVRVADINDHIALFNKCYFAGCIFNGIAELMKNTERMNSEYSGYYYYEKN